MLDGSTIRAAREAKGLSQAALAEMVGTTQQTIDKIENNRIERTSYLPEIWEALGIKDAPPSSIDPIPTMNTGMVGCLAPLAVLRTILCANPTAEQILAALAANGFGVVPLGGKSPTTDTGIGMLRSIASGKVDPAKIAEVRKEKGLSQEALSEILDCHWVTISNLERGEKPLTVEWMLRIADALAVDPATFFEKPTEPVDDPKAYVQDVLQRHKLSPGGLAAKVGVSASTLSRAMNDPGHKFKFSVGTLQKIREWDRSNGG
jgi:transcriptional regulator with XRE-family HTH domain